MTDAEIRAALVELDHSVRMTQARQADLMNEMRRRALQADAAIANETGHGAQGRFVSTSSPVETPSRLGSHA